jgi:iron(III) transport system ATP-binding protein
MTQIDLRAVSKRFGATPVLERIDLTIAGGELVAVLGASGSGKTTLLRLIAGFERAGSGAIAIGGRVVDDESRFTGPRQRSVGYVPQEGALFPHLTVAKNVGFGLARADHGAIGELLDLVGLRDLARRYPHELSGGQQQRVAIARALAVRPQVLLLDEPFGALDAPLRAALRADIMKILAATGTTTVLVTHDQDEALTLAHRVAILHERRIAACAEPQALYREPPTLDVATLLGDANVLRAVVAGPATAEGPLGTLHIAPREPLRSGQACRVLIRPEQIELRDESGAGASATVISVDFHGHDALVRFEVSGGDGPELLARVSGDLRLAPGISVRVSVADVAPAWAWTGR